MMSLRGPAGESSPQAASAASATRPHRGHLFAGKRPLLYLDMVSSFRAEARGRLRCSRWPHSTKHRGSGARAQTSPGGAIPGLGRLLGSKTNVRSSSRIQEAHHFLTDLDNTNAERPFGSSAVLGFFVASQVRRRGGGEDPWLCDPGFRRVCLNHLVSRLQRRIGDRSGQERQGCPSVTDSEALRRHDDVPG